MRETPETVAVEAGHPEEDELLTFLEYLRKVGLVEKLDRERAAVVRDAKFQNAHLLASCPPVTEHQNGAPDQNGPTWTNFRDGAKVGAILIAEGLVAKQIRRRLDSGLAQYQGALLPHTLDETNRRR